MGKNNEIKLQVLKCKFLKLTDINQQYVLGIAVGLKQAQMAIVRNSQINRKLFNNSAGFRNSTKGENSI